MEDRPYSWLAQTGTQRDGWWCTRSWWTQGGLGDHGNMGGCARFGLWWYVDSEDVVVVPEGHNIVYVYLLHEFAAP